MAQAAAIVINDGQATPVATTFSPESVAPSLSTFADRSTGIALGYRRLRISNTFASGKSVVNRAKFSVELPVTQTVSGVVSVAYTLRANLDIALPDGATDAQRKDLFAFLKNGIANSLIQGALRDLDPVY